MENVKRQSDGIEEEGAATGRRLWPRQRATGSKQVVTSSQRLNLSDAI